MTIEEQFNLIAEEYDAGRRKFIPCFDDFYIGSTDFIAEYITPPARVLDLGAGTGLLTMFWYKRFPNAEYVLADIAEEMLKVAKKRFEGAKNVSFINCDYTKALPDGSFDAVISALSVHHLEDEEKRRLFCDIYSRLPEGGMFINYDQFCAEEKAFSSWFDEYWQNGFQDRGLSAEDIEKWRERRLLDRECSVAEEIQMLKDAGFCAVQCVYSCRKFAVIAAVK